MRKLENRELKQLMGGNGQICESDFTLPGVTAVPGSDPKDNGNKIYSPPCEDDII